MSDIIKVYSMRNCGACTTTKTFLSNNNIPYEEIKIEGNKEAVKFIKSKAITSMPLVQKGDTIIVGFNPAELLRLAK